MIGHVVIIGQLILGLTYIPMAMDMCGRLNMLHLFLMQYMQCIKDQYVQHWHASCLRNKKLEHYVNYKNMFQTERYITAIDID